MSGVVSAGLLVHRMTGGPAFLLVHPGGPFWKNKDTAAWSIPKGVVDDGEDLFTAALREFREETGQAFAGTGIALEPCRAHGKVVHAWLVAADYDVATFTSNTFEIEWPPKSGRLVAFPEVDRAAYFEPGEALIRIHRGQRPIIEEAIDRLRDARC